MPLFDCFGDNRGALGALVVYYPLERVWVGGSWCWRCDVMTITDKRVTVKASLTFNHDWISHLRAEPA